MSLESHALHCSECSVPVGSDGPQRAALLLPCEHVTHVSCAEFVARKIKYFRRLTAADATTAAEMADDGVPTASTFFCPGCGEEVERIVPLYLSHEEARPVNAATSTRFERAHEAQRQCLRSLRRLWEMKNKVMGLGHRCAALHTQRAAHLRELEQYQLIFSPAVVGDAAMAQSAAARTASRVDEMSVSELELYLSQSTPALLNSQGALRRERRQLEQNKKKLDALKRQYQTRKELARLNKQIEAVSEKPCAAVASEGHAHTTAVPTDADRAHGRNAAPARGVPPLHAHSLRAMSDYVAAKAATGGVAQQLPLRTTHHKRRRECDVVDVDELRLPVRPAPTRAATGAPQLVHYLDDTELNDAPRDVDRSEAQLETGGLRAAHHTPKEVIDVDDDDEDDEDAVQVEVNAGPTTAVTWPSTVASTSASDSMFASIDPADVAEAMGEALPVFVPCILSKSNPQVPLSRHLRLLPRREDRLWQPSLQF